MTKICGMLVGLTWLVCSASGFFLVYMLLTFYIFSPVPVLTNFRENRVAVISGSLASVAFLTGGIGVFLRRPWARSLSILLGVLGAAFAIVQILNRGGSSIHLEPIVAGPLALASFLILAWLFTRAGRTYFQQAVGAE